MLEVHIRITDADAPLSAKEMAVLTALGYSMPGGDQLSQGADYNTEPATESKPQSTQVTEKLQAEKAKAPAAKAAPAKATASKAQTKTEPAAEPTPPAGDDADAKMEQAVGRATALINSGDADKLRTLLSEIGVKRVSELTGDDLDTFLEKTAAA